MKQELSIEWILTHLRRDVIESLRSKSQVVVLNPDHPDPEYRCFDMVTMDDVYETLNVCFGTLLGGDA